MKNDLGECTFAVTLRSEWQGAIPRVNLATCWVNEKPQLVPGAPAHLQQTRMLSGTESMFQRIAPIDMLPPNYTYPFVYQPQALSAFLSRVAALSPERYWIALLTEGYEFDRIPGAEVAAFLDTRPNEELRSG